MMHRAWAKIVVAGLFVLGEGTFASGYVERDDDRQAPNGSVVQQLQPTALDDTGSGGQLAPVDARAIRPGIDLTLQTYAVITATATELLKYHPFRPRAPPVPAS